MDLLDIVRDLQSLGAPGAIPFGAVYVLAILLLAPAVPFPVAAGFLYGPVLGFLAAWTAQLLAAWIAWALGRGVLRRQARRLTRRFPVLDALDQAIQQDSFKLIVLVRMSPLFPFGPVNYFLGVTGVRVWPYLAATAVGLAPLCLLLTWAGSTLPTLATALQGQASLGTTETVVSLVGLTASVLVVVLVTRATRRALLQVLEEE
jgi:uncharacterized membrane protein YdjX (TVP38/TMEM64 family)